MNKLFFNVILKVSALLSAFLLLPVYRDIINQEEGQARVLYLYYIFVIWQTVLLYVLLVYVLLVQLSPTVTTWFVLGFEFTIF